LARKSRAYGERLPWDEALRWFREDELRAAAKSVQGISNWKTLGVPSHAVVRLLRARRETPELIGTSKPSPLPEHLDPEWQETHTFTAMVTALRKLEARYPLGSKSPNAWRARVGWEAMMAGASTLLEVAGWTDDDWKKIMRDGEDLWKKPKPAKHSEAETLRERLQQEIGFTWEGEG
jgi:hypothetical protein